MIHLDRVAEAMADLQQSMEEDPELANSRLHMAYCYFRVKEYDKCIALCDQALGLQAGFGFVALS